MLKQSQGTAFEATLDPDVREKLATIRWQYKTLGVYKTVANLFRNEADNEPVKLAAYQAALIRAVVERTHPGDPRLPNGGPNRGKPINSVLALYPTGCHAKGQLILMYDGSTKAVEDIVVGDLLMGPDSKPRTVLQLCRGRQEMARIVPRKGDAFVVNLDHVLVLRRRPINGAARRDVQITVRDFLNESKWERNLHYLIRSDGIEYTERKLPIDPYFVGLYLGDGTRLHANESVSPNIASMDKEVASAIETEAKKWGLRYRRTDRPHTPCSAHYLVGKFNGPRASRENPLKAALIAAEGVALRCEKKFIPHEYMTSSRNQRLELLAGLLDTDGSLSPTNMFDFVSKSPKLARGVMLLARSLGFTAQLRRRHVRKYWRVTITGPVHLIPTRIGRKRAAQRNTVQWRWNYFDIELLPADEYFGFTLDGDGLYLLEDFTITHNSGKSYSLAIAYVLNGIMRRDRMANIAPTEDQAQTVFKHAKWMLLNSDPLLQAMIDRRQPFTYSQITFQTGASLICKTAGGSSGSGLLSHHYDLVGTDERALIEDEIYDTKILRMVARDGRMAMHVDITTTQHSQPPHAGTKQMMDEGMYDLVLRTSYKEVLAAGRFDKSLIEARKRRLSPSEFQRWYCSQFVDDEIGAAISYESITAAVRAGEALGIPAGA